MVDSHNTAYRGSRIALRDCRPRCVYCGSYCHKPSDGSDPVCRHCKSIQSTIDYVPQWDPHFFNKVRNLIVFPPSGRAGDWVQPHRLLGCRHEDVKFAVRRLRRQGWVIEGRRGNGYRLHLFGEQSVPEQTHTAGHP